MEYLSIGLRPFEQWALKYAAILLPFLRWPGRLQDPSGIIICAHVQTVLCLKLSTRFVNDTPPLTIFS